MRAIKPSKKSKSKMPLDKVKASFVSSGAFQINNPAKIFYGNEEAGGSIPFPNPHPKHIDQAIKMAKKSGFGKGTENVVDESYRMAFEYLPQSLGLPSQLQEKVLQEVTKAVSHQLCSKGEVRAELIKLNIYPTGGMFKSHVDSPKADAFGSLVVFLPCAFEGGELTVEHKGQVKVFSFGGSGPDSMQVNWVAFFNDCVHHISEVKGGFRITLSYNLFYCAPDPTLTIYPKEEILEVLSSMSENKVYGYYCEHYYGNNALSNMKEGWQLQLLKGKDSEVFNACKALQVKNIQVQVIYKMQIRDEGIQKMVTMMGPPSSISEVKLGAFYHESYDDIRPEEEIKTKFNGTEVDEEIEWLNNQTEDSKYTYAIDGYYGNDYTMHQSYCMLAILINT